MFSNGHSTRARIDRGSQFDIVPSRLDQWWKLLRRGDVLLRLAIALMAGLCMLLALRAWQPSFPYRLGQVPPRTILARVTFEKKDVPKTRERQDQAVRTMECVYRHDPKLLVELRTTLKGRLARLLEATSMDTVHEVWNEFVFEWPDSQINELTTNPSTPKTTLVAVVDSPAAPATAVNALDLASPNAENSAGPHRLETLEELRQLFAEDIELAELDRRLLRAFENLDRFGVLEELQHRPEEGSQTEITVVSAADGKPLPRVPVEDVRRPEALRRLQTRLELEISPPVLSQAIFEWFRQRLPNTLTLDLEATQAARRAVREAVVPVMMQFEAGKSVIASAGVPLGESELQLLRLEHAAQLRQLTWRDMTLRLLGNTGMYLAVFILCGTYLHFREPRLLRDLRSYLTLIGITMASVTLAQVCSIDPWQVELVPLMMFGITVGITYRNEVAFLLIAVCSLLVALTLGRPLPDFVTYAATLASTVFLLAHVRSRTKLIYVGLWAAVVASTTTAGVWSLSEGTLGPPLLVRALWQGGMTLLAAMLMTALLPFVEKLMEVQTELSLLELGDVAHPLLQELAQRAPGTYNHSISVASIAQTAAESIGANGLLVRVGAYFHDIGKMLKPQYFSENQEAGQNRHDNLMPAMSTLIIIAHVKDGANLARQHHLPKSVIDFILQHHGTTVVEYFFNRASRQSESNPNGSQVAEYSYRYPGPKPRTKETAVLMLADAAESAARALPEPNPSRIESLVEKLARDRLLDGQFDDCDLTLQELHTIERSIIKSLIATYHGRLRYPEKQPV